MSVLNSNPFLIASGSPNDPAVPLQRSVRLRSSAPAYFSRTPASATNRQKYTLSLWLKRGTLGTNQALFSASDGTQNNEFLIYFGTGNSLNIQQTVGGTSAGQISCATNAVYRDLSSWYHIVVAIDTTQATSTNRLILYINGVAQTFLSYSVGSSINTWVDNTNPHALGKRSDASLYFDGYLTEVNFIDGQALTPSSFGGYNAGTNVWEVRKYTGSYGTNGFYLPFTDNSGSTATTIGKDFSGNNNNWTPNNINAIPATTAYSITGYDVIRGGGAFANPTLPASGNGTNAFHFPKTTGTYTLNKTLTATSKIEAYCYTDGSSAASITANGGTAKTAPVGSGFAWQKVNLGVTSLSSITIANSNWTNSDFWLSCFIVDDVVVYGTTTLMVTCDSMLDVPTNTGSNNANFCVLNPLSTNVTGIVPQQGNLYLGSSVTYNYSIVGTIGVSSGKWYWECRTDSGFSMVGITSLSSLPLQIAPHQSGSLAKIIYAAAAAKYDNGTSSAYGATWTSADTIGIALDMDAGTLTFYKNGTSLGVAFTGLTGIYYPVFGGPNSYNHGWINFGQRPFAQTPPSGFKSLNTYNLPEPTIPRGDKYFKQYLYTGNGGGQQIGEIQKPASLFNLDRSLRLRASNSAYLNRTAGTATSTTTWTWSAWVKRGTLGTTQVLFSGGSAASNNACIGFTSDSLDVYNFISSVIKARKITTQVFRDPLAWNHIVIAASGSSSLNVYVNGIQVTSFSTNTNPDGSAWLFQSGSIRIGADAYAVSNLFDGYLADVYFVDGQALAPTSFGAYDGNNYWTPIAYTGTYGTNGFHLEFEDFSAATATAIGKDTSGQGNNWTPTGIDLTTPQVDNEYWDSYTDVPTNNDADTCNYCTLDPLQPSSTGLRNGNLTAIWTTANTAYKQRGTYTLNTGKWYFEGNLESFVVGNTGNTNFAIGFITTSGVDTHVSFGWTTTGATMKLGYRYDVAGVLVQNVTYNTVTPVATDIFGIEYDVDNGTANFYKNGTLMGSASGLALGTVNPHIWRTGSSNSATMHVNFGQRAFKYGPSTGYKKINAVNVAEVTGDVETPDLVRIKSRSATTAALWFNSVSGVGKYLTGNNSTAAEATDPNSIIEFNKNGLLIGNNANINTSAATYIADVWKAGETTQNITVGQYATSPANIPSIASTVRANPISGISVVSYTGISVPGTVGHGLGVAPKFIIVKSKTGGTSSWAVWHTALTGNEYLLLESTAGKGTASTVWNGTTPTSNVFSVGSGSVPNTSGWTYVAYCFSEVPGFSKFDSYVSNGSATDGPFVYTGFRPRWVMIKQRDATRSWIMYDTTRNTYNIVDKYFFMEGLNNNEQTAALLDINSNGFKLKNNNLNTNTTAGSVYIYMAFAENPFKYALAR